MRIVVRLILAFLVLIVVGLIALAVVLPGLAESPEVRRTIEEASTNAVGRPLRYGDLSVGLIPPRLELSKPEIPGATEQEPALFAAEEISLRIALLPLLTMRVVVDSLVIDGLAVEVSRTADGIDLPTPPEPPAADAKQPAATASSESAPLDLAVRSVMVRDASLTLVDRTLSPPVTWRIQDIEVMATGHGPGRPIEIEGTAAVASGGMLSLSGTATLDAVIDLTVHVNELALANASPYAGEDADLAALLDAKILAKGPAAALESLNLNAQLRADALRSGDVTVTGDLDLEVALTGDPAVPNGRFSVDASGAEIASADAFRKPSGTPATVAGEIATRGTTTSVQIEKLELASFVATGKATLAEKTRIELSAEPFALAGIVALLPAAEGLSVEGQGSLRGFAAEVEPLSLEGEIRLDSMGLGLEGGGRIDVSGRIVGQGDGVALVDWQIESGGQRLLLSGDARDLSGEIPFEVKLNSEGVLRANDLLTGLSPSSKNVLYGPLVVDAAISGRAGATGSETALTDSLVGFLNLDLGTLVGDGKEGGRFVGFSALGSVFYRLEQAGELVRVAGVLTGGKVPDLHEFTSEEFDSFAAHFRIKDGLLESERVRIVYRHHAVNLVGTIALSDFALDMTGEVHLGSQVVGALGAQAADGEVVVPLAHIGGTLEAPEVEVSKRAATTLGAQLIARNPKVKSALEEAERVLPGAGQLLEKGLGGLLHGGKE